MYGLALILVLASGMNPLPPVTAAPSKTISLKTIRTYDALPDNIDLFIELPGDAFVDDSGRLHVFDHRSCTIMVWDSDGRFVDTYGRKGEGPGEFSVFGRSGGPQGFVTVVEDTIYVYDGGSRKLSEFGKDLKFRSSRPFTIEAGRVEEFRPLGNDQIAVFYSSYFSTPPFRKVAIYSGDKGDEVEMMRVKDETWQYINEGGARRVEINAYSPQLHISVNHKARKMVLGDSHKSGFDVFDFKGNKLQTVTAKLLQNEVTPELRDEYNSQNFIKNNTFFTTKFPDKRAFYEGILMVGDDRYLVFLKSPVYGNMEGYLIDEKGENLGRFTYELGEGGSIYSTQGRLIVCATNEEGDYVIKEVAVAGREQPGMQ